jgi:hypothetical protein
MHGTIKSLGYLILVLMALSVVYASYISIKYWTGIGV